MNKLGTKHKHRYTHIEMKQLTLSLQFHRYYYCLLFILITTSLMNVCYVQVKTRWKVPALLYGIFLPTLFYTLDSDYGPHLSNLCRIWWRTFSIRQVSQVQLFSLEEISLASVLICTVLIIIVIDEHLSYYTVYLPDHALFVIHLSCSK